MASRPRSRAAASPDAQAAAEELAWLALRLGRLAAGDPASQGLTASQWGALRFLARANRFSRTVSALAEFQSTTRGTVSQTIKGLVVRGLLRRSPSERDGRSVRFDLTEAGRRALDRDPFRAVVRQAAGLTARERARLAEGLKVLLPGAGRNGAPTPPSGRCSLCGHLRPGAADGGYACGLLGEALAHAELAEHCMRFSARPA